MIKHMPTAEQIRRAADEASGSKFLMIDASRLRDLCIEAEVGQTTGLLHRLAERDAHEFLAGLHIGLKVAEIMDRDRTGPMDPAFVAELLADGWTREGIQQVQYMRRCQQRAMTPEPAATVEQQNGFADAVLGDITPEFNPATFATPKAGAHDPCPCGKVRLQHANETLCTPPHPAALCTCGHVGRLHAEGRCTSKYGGDPPHVTPCDCQAFTLSQAFTPL